MLEDKNLWGYGVWKLAFCLLLFSFIFSTELTHNEKIPTYLIVLELLAIESYLAAKLRV
jgi:hypothetical protein|tara:strand:+ start:435 stop:611 length:177 start_codon:yes stop_codon:yes gene_type:complete